MCHLNLIFFSFQDSVVCVSFNWDSSYLSSCDLSGVVKVWGTTKYDNVASFDAGELSVILSTQISLAQYYLQSCLTNK